MTVVLSRVDPLVERQHWLNARRDGIGGSDIAGLLNMSRWSSPMSVYLDKVGLVDNDEPTEQMEIGQKIEGFIGDLFEERTGLRIIERQVVAVNPDRPWERATLDGLVGESLTSVLDDAVGVIEIKNTADFAWDAVPDEYLIQVQWQLGIAELDQAWVAVLHAGRRLAIYEVAFDPSVFADLQRIAASFWEHHVLAQNPPPADGEPATTDALKSAYNARADGTAVEFGIELAALCVAWQHRKKHLADEKARVDAIENEIRAALAAHEIGTHAGVELVTWKPQTRRTFDLEGFRDSWPDLAAAYMRESAPTRTLRASRALRERAGI